MDSPQQTEFRSICSTQSTEKHPVRQSWINLSVLAICFATFFSDVSHEIATAVLPLYFATIGLGPHVLGWVEGVANFALNLGRLVGGLLGHMSRRKKNWAASGYMVTTVATAGLGLTTLPTLLTSLRATAWFARGFRSPLRDYLLAQAVKPQYFGRAYGLERTGDMMGAIVGPVAALTLLAVGWSYPAVIVTGFFPGLVAAALLFFLVQEHPMHSAGGEKAAPADPPPLHQGFARLPLRFWILLAGMFLFALGNFARSFLIFLVARAVGHDAATAGGIALPVVLYTLHNIASAFAPYPAGMIADRTSRVGILAAGYALGALTSILCAGWAHSLPVLALAMIFSGLSLAIEEAMERATMAEILPPELRSLGFGLVGFVVALGQLTASMYVGYLLASDAVVTAFTIAAIFSASGTLWMIALGRAAGRSSPPRL